MTAASARISYLDGLRGLAALNVAISHFLTAFDFAVYTGRPESAHGQWEVTASAFPFIFPAAGANFAVCIFLALSGFVLAQAFRRSTLSAPAQIAKRVIRLGLPVLGASLLGWMVLAAGWTFNVEAAAVTRSPWLVGQMTQQPSIVGAILEAGQGLLGAPAFATSYNSVLWTMPIEFVGSLILITVFATGIPTQYPRLGGALLAGGGVVLSGSYVALVLLGAALHLLDVGRFTERLQFRPALLTVILALGTVPFSDARGQLWDALVMLAPRLSLGIDAVPGFVAAKGVETWHGVAALLLLALITGWPAARTILSAPCTTFLGRISFPLYLVHIPVLFSVSCGVFVALDRTGLSYGPAVAIAFVAYGATAVGLAWAAAEYVEVPAIKLAASAGATISRQAEPRIA